MTRVIEEALTRFVGDILTCAGVDSFSCQAVSQSLVQANLRGIDSHGVRLLPLYIDCAEKGGINKNPQFGVKRTFPCCCCIDADNGFGAAAGFRAIDECMKIAEEQGLAIASVINSSHSGYMAAFTLRAAAKGFIAFAFTNTGPAMLSYNGSGQYFGTNPICFAAPREESDPFCVDMATTGKTHNSVELAKLTGSELDEGQGTMQIQMER
jgi:LDH2 family malate/lactate/ureidoglycolate dehydrogenase